MNFPKFWAKATAEETSPNGRKDWFTQWGWSNESYDHAYQTALSSARRTLQRFLKGEDLSRYPYGSDSAIREEVIESMTDDEGKPLTVVTQNAYGSLVLNTSRVMFIDIDFAPATFKDIWRGLFTMFRKTEPESHESKQESMIREQVKAFHHQNHRHWGMRIYRTAAGVRVLVTHGLFDPRDPATREILTELGSDPQYILLCEKQGCFRARLTPKPWRCGHYARQVKWPYADAAEQQTHAQWQNEYERLQSDYATCRLVEELGPQEVHADVLPILHLHDRFTRCDDAKPLA